MAFRKSFEEYINITGDITTSRKSNASALINALNVKVSPEVPRIESTLVYPKCKRTAINMLKMRKTTLKEIGEK